MDRNSSAFGGGRGVLFDGADEELDDEELEDDELEEDMLEDEELENDETIRNDGNLPPR